MFDTPHVSDTEKNPNQAAHALFVWVTGKQETDKMLPKLPPAVEERLKQLGQKK